MAFITFHILGMSKPQLTKSFFSEGRAQPPTSYDVGIYQIYGIFVYKKHK